MSTTKNSSTSNRNRCNPTSKMFDLKMCFLDLMRMTTNGTRQKKSTIKEMSTRNYPQYANHRFNDTNMIYFNENMSMTSRSSTIRFSRCPTGNFNPNATTTQPPPLYESYEWMDPINTTKPPISASPIGGGGSSNGIAGGGGGGGGSGSSSINHHNHHPTIGATYNRFNNMRRLPNIPNIMINQHQLPMAGDQFFDSSSDERMASSTVEHTMSSFTDSPLSDSSMRGTETDDCICSYSDCGQTMLDEHSMTGLDSFCTLCTSSFSFNRCNQCEESSCGSKCEIIDDKKLIDDRNSENTSAGGESSGNVSSDCESVKFR